MSYSSALLLCSVHLYSALFLQDQKYSGYCISRPAQFRMDQIVQQSVDNFTLRVDGACSRHVATH